jgi:hypothetical protein
MNRIVRQMSGTKREEVGEGFIICIAHKMLLR